MTIDVRGVLGQQIPAGPPPAGITITLEAELPAGGNGTSVAVPSLGGAAAGSDMMYVVGHQGNFDASWTDPPVYWNPDEPGVHDNDPAAGSTTCEVSIAIQPGVLVDTNYTWTFAGSASHHYAVFSMVGGTWDQTAANIDVSTGWGIRNQFSLGQRASGEGITPGTVSFAVMSAGHNNTSTLPPACVARGTGSPPWVELCNLVWDGSARRIRTQVFMYEHDDDTRASTIWDWTDTQCRPKGSIYMVHPL